MLRNATLVLALLGGLARAQEPAPDAASATLPRDAVFVVRFAPAARLDEAGAMLEPLFRKLSGPEKLSRVLLPVEVLRAKGARDRPVYLTLGKSGPAWYVEAKDGDVSRLARVDGGETGEPRAGPIAFLPGHVSLHFELGAELVAQGEKHLRDALANMDAAARELDLPVPPAAMAFAKGLVGVALDVVLGVESIDYALTLDAESGLLLSRGRCAARDGTALRALLDRMGPSAPHDLVDLLDRDAMLSIDTCGPGSRLDAAVAGFLDRTFGEGAGKDLLLLLAPSFALHEHLTGKGAGTVSVGGPMSMRMTSVFEAKPGDGLAKAIAALDADRVNRRLAALGLPLEIGIERAIEHAGETPIHRIRYQSAIPQAAMYAAQLDFCFAVEDGLLLSAQSATALADLERLLARVRRLRAAEGKAAEAEPHPHRAAMARLMPEGRHEGLTVDLGKLKPLLGLFAFLSPEVGRIAQVYPDTLRLSTALRVRDGVIEIAGDWPVKDLTALLR